MNHCTQCGSALGAADQFCGKCGHPRGGAGQDRRRNPHRDRPPRHDAVPALKTEAGRTAFNAIIAHKAARTRKARMVLVVMALLLAVMCAVAWKTPLAPWFGVPAGICALLALLVNCSRWSEADYYSVPGSKDERGEHRCLHCGHRGIYRHGQYKSNTEYADCSKCKTNLWVE